jgi:hypothetical protein
MGISGRGLIDSDTATPEQSAELVGWPPRQRCMRAVLGDPAMALYCEPVTSTLGADLAAGPRTARFRVTGHFDDPQARGCWNVPVGVSLDSRGQPEPDAVIACRERFVVTEAVRLE